MIVLAISGDGNLRVASPGMLDVTRLLPARANRAVSAPGDEPRLLTRRAPVCIFHHPFTPNLKASDLHYSASESLPVFHLVEQERIETHKEKAFAKNGSLNILSTF